MRTMQEIAKEAMLVQDASNIVAVAKGFAKVVKELMKDHNVDSDSINKHPVVTLWISKLVSMNYGRTDTSFGEDYCKVNDLWKGLNQNED